MKLTFDAYREKLRGCWLGKNIGGVLGAPFEGRREVNDVDFYIQDLHGNPPPNDDLDLQLVWLNAVEEYGRRVDASILGEYWLSFIIPDWVEYGAGKNNLRMGLVPPLSGYFDNNYKDSCGCFIRSEIWASLAPGNPELAVRYAYEDGIVDHADEGLYGELFCAAVQSAAFVESDADRLIDIGLSYIPEGCGVAHAIHTARAAYRAGKSWKEARVDVLTAEPGTFGIQGTPIRDFPTDVPAGKPGYDAPGNLGITVIGWLYGEGDFGKSICIANNCGEDTDCTAATLGAILGIVGGASSIPEKWSAPVGDAITTCCINMLNGGIDIPRTVTALTDRILRLTPSFLGRSLCDLFAEGGYTIEVQEGDGLFCPKGARYLPSINGGGKDKRPSIAELIASRHVVRQRFSTFDTALDYLGDPCIRIGEPKKLRLTVRDNHNSHNHQWVTVKCFTPEGTAVSPAGAASFFLKSTYLDVTTLEFEVTASSLPSSRLDLLFDISVNGRHSSGVVRATLIPVNGFTERE